jgi:predicted TIM-barrel fold metal-dependent hydrolase
MFHTGTSVFPGARLKYSNPLYLDDLAVDFPDLTIIMAHGGRGPWFSTAFYLARMHSNVFIDISGLPPKNLLTYFPKLESISEKVVFGSDWPDTLNIGANIEAVKQLALSEKAKMQILGTNAAKILRL